MNRKVLGRDAEIVETFVLIEVYTVKNQFTKTVSPDAVSAMSCGTVIHPGYVSGNGLTAPLLFVVDVLVYLGDGEGYLSPRKPELPLGASIRKMCSLPSGYLKTTGIFCL